MMQSTSVASPMSITISDVAVTLDGAHLLHGATCNFPYRGFTAVIGPNGSGKSTLMRVMARQLRPSRGGVWFAGRDLSGLSDRAFAREVAYLPQSIPAAPGMTVRELVALGRYPWHGPLGKFGPEDAQKVEEALGLTGTALFADRIIDTLSGGERQRCWLSMLMAQNARLLLLDEPTSALDVAQQHGALRLLDRLCRARGCGVIIVLHDMNLAASYCDRIVALRSGKVIAEGTPAEIMLPKTLQEVFGTPMLVTQHPQTQKPYCFVDSSAPS